MFFPPKEVVDRIKRDYPKGTKVKLVSMNDPYRDMPPGLTGVVEYVDDCGTIFPAWSNGSHLGIVYGEDHVVKISE